MIEIVLCIVVLAQMVVNAAVCVYIVKPPKGKTPVAPPADEKADELTVRAEQQWMEGFQNLMTYSMADAMRKDDGLERED